MVNIKGKLPFKCFLSYEEEANFIRKLKKGSGKYKGKLPFKCFNFASKCPYPKKKDSGYGETYNLKEHKKGKVGKKKKIYKKKKNLYSKEGNSSSDMSEDDEIELLFMGIETQANDAEKDHYEDEQNREDEE